MDIIQVTLVKHTSHFLVCGCELNYDELWIIYQQAQVQTAAHLPRALAVLSWMIKNLPTCCFCFTSLLSSVICCWVSGCLTGYTFPLIASRWLKSWNAAGLSTPVSVVLSVQCEVMADVSPRAANKVPARVDMNKPARKCVRSTWFTSRHSRWTSCPCCVCWGRFCCPSVCRYWMGAGWVHTSGQHRWGEAPWSRTTREGDSCCTFLAVRCSAAPTDGGQQEVKCQQQNKAQD